MESSRRERRDLAVAVGGMDEAAVEVEQEEEKRVEQQQLRRRAEMK